MWKLWPAVGFEPANSGFPTAVKPDTCIIQDTNDSAYLNSARHGQFQEKEKTPTTDLNICLSKNFSTKISKSKLQLSPRFRVAIFQLSMMINFALQISWYWAARHRKFLSSCLLVCGSSELTSPFPIEVWKWPLQAQIVKIFVFCALVNHENCWPVFQTSKMIA